MATNVIEFDGLRKEYRRRGGPRIAVDGLDLAVPEGGVFGFLGPNGSGKTTSIRCLLGLVRPTGGRVRLLGEGVPDGLPRTLARVGAIVESPALFPTMTGRENLGLLARVGRVPRSRVDSLLEEVGLADASGDLVRKYSLGMRQRLGLAAALLKDPALLVLDEPANGLDPAGMRQVRELVRRLGSEGRTVFLSSHLLSEIEQTCDSVAILRRGRCVEQGPVAEVMRSRGALAMLVKTKDLVAAHGALVAAGYPSERVDGQIRVSVGPDEAADLSRTLAEAGCWLTGLRPEERTLEERFLELTSDPSDGDESMGWPVADGEARTMS